MDNRELLQRAQEHTGVKSQRELAKLIGMNNSSLSLLASGKGELSDDTYVKLAKLAGIDPAQVLIEKHMKKAGPEAAPLWKQIQKYLPKSAGLAALVLCSSVMITKPENAEACAIYQVPSINIMRTIHLVIQILSDYINKSISTSGANAWMTALVSSSSAMS